MYKLRFRDKMVKIRQSPKLPAQKRREQLLKSAQKLFLKKGYRATTTEQIARNAGLTKGALYFHFKNKEGILFELVKLVMEKHMEVFERISYKQASPVDFLKILFDCNQKCQRDEFRNNIDFWVQAMRITKIKRYLNKCYRQAVEKFVEDIKPIYCKNKKESKQLAIFTFSVFDGLLVRSILDPTAVDTSAQIKLFDSLLKNKYIKSDAKKRGK